MDLNLKSKIAVVTGGASGIGACVVRRLVAEGAFVVIADRDRQLAAQLQAELAQNTVAFEVDTASPTQVQALVTYVEEQFGPLQLAVNSAGISGRRETAIADLDVVDWQKTIDINLNGVFYCLKYQVQSMLRGGGGAIVNLGSILGKVGVAGSAAYVSSKHALMGLTKTAALDYAQKNIRINLVAPGYIDTPLLATGMSAAFKAGLESKHPMGRLGEAEEIAELCLFLLSERASFITGASYMADGGYTIY